MKIILDDTPLQFMRNLINFMVCLLPENNLINNTYFTNNPKFTFTNDREL